MERPYILHMFTTGRQMSPFDINMAADAGYQMVLPYSHVEFENIVSLTQDVIFSRGPKGVARTGIFIGGRDSVIAADMLDKAKGAMQKPFAVSVMADPSGAYTTAGAMVAYVEAALERLHGAGLKGRRVLVLGGIGPVGRVVGVLAAQAGATVSLSSHEGLDAAEQAARVTSARFGVDMSGVSGETPEHLRASLANIDVVLSCTPAGIQSLSSEDIQFAPALKIAADLNAVSPTGIEGVSMMSDCVPISGTQAVGIGALVIGNVKYQTQHQLLVDMHDAPKAVYLSFPEAYAKARAILAASVA